MMTNMAYCILIASPMASWQTQSGFLPHQSTLSQCHIALMSTQGSLTMTHFTRLRCCSAHSW